MEYRYIDSSLGLHDGYDQTSMYSSTFNDEFIQVKSVLVDRGDQFGVSAVGFDGQEEMLWMGNAGGHVTSYYGLPMTVNRYTSFQVHQTDEIRQLLSWNRCIFSLTADTLHCASKFGLPVYHHQSPSLCNMQCMLQTGPNVLIMGGHQPLLVSFDLETRQEIEQVEVDEAGCAILRATPTFICSGDTSGNVSLLDPQSLNCVHRLHAHTGTLSDFDVCGNQLVTCGFSNRNGSLTVDRLLMIFDMRYLKKMTPLQLSIDPLFLRFIPTFSNRICVVSQSGVFQVLEQGLLSQCPVYQLPMVAGALVTSFDLSRSNQMLAFGDTCGQLHIFASNTEHPTINDYSEEIEFATVLEPPVHPISFDDDLTPYSIIPTVYPTSANEKLLSDWPDHLCQFVYRKQAAWDPEILRAVKPRDESAVLYAARPATLHANQVPYELKESGTSKSSSVAPSSTSRQEDDTVPVIPKCYRKVEIKYSKLGVEDFDFRYYNKTNFAGLETHIPNAYCNALLQVLYFIEPLRCALISHLCEREFCLACELGYLCHMLDQQKGKTCQATNFLRAFRTIREAAALDLILGESDDEFRKSNLARLIQRWNRFIIQQVDSELSGDQQSGRVAVKQPTAASVLTVSSSSQDLAALTGSPSKPPPLTLDPATTTTTTATAAAATATGDDSSQPAQT